MKSAFVLMSFSTKYQDIYDHFLKPVLTEAGFSVARADDLSTGQNIMADIVQSICAADLVVAEITAPNPNVYYELGIAHAMRIPTIILSQDIDALPFDLRSYRILTYTTDFVAIQGAKEKLRILAESVGTELAQFSSPVADFAKPIPLKASHVSGSKYNAKSGVIDFFADFDESVIEINAAIESLAEQVQLMGQKAVQNTDRLVLSNNIERRNILREFSIEINRYVTLTNRGCREYSMAVDKFENSSMKIFENPEILAHFDDKEKAESLLESVINSEKIGRESHASVSSFRDTLKNMPSLEFNFNIAVDSAAEATTSVLQTMDRHISVFSKTKFICKEIIESISDS